MQLGNIEQVGAPLDLYDRPTNLFVAGFIGSPAMNLIHGTLHRSNGSAKIRAEDGSNIDIGGNLPGEEGQKVVFGTRPEHLEIAPDGEGIATRIDVVEPTGSETFMLGEAMGIPIQAAFRERHDLQPGQTIALRPDLGHAHVFDADSGRRLEL